MLEEDEALELGLEREAISAEVANLRFVNFPIPDRGTPPEKLAFEEFLKNLEILLAAGRQIGSSLPCLYRPFIRHCCKSVSPVGHTSGKRMAAGLKYLAAAWCQTQPNSMSGSIAI